MKSDKLEIAKSNYNWVSYGNESNPVIALIAPSNAFADKAGQKIINVRINKLVEKGFCVKVPKFNDGSLLVEPEFEGRKKSERLMDSVSPAVSKEVGASQIIDCISKGWNIMPFMGGDGFEEKIPLLIDYYSRNPQEKNSAVKFFGMSNSTYATALMSHGICSFVSTPFTNIFLRSDPASELFDEKLILPAEGLEKTLKGQRVEDFSRKIICDSTKKLDSIKTTFHYPLNSGNISQEVRGNKLLHIPSDQIWSISVEGFIQRPGNKELIEYAGLLDKFLEQHRDNLPAFIEIGNLATRLDGQNGYSNLLHDKETGLISIESYNIKKLLSQRKDLNSETVVEMLKWQNSILEKIIKEVSEVASKHGVALIQNTRNGHCANMDIVQGGLIKVRTVGDRVEIESAESQQSKFKSLETAKLLASGAGRQKDD
ncbi:MAG: hypothetical protein KGQ36_07275 [Rickettsiales bacterium]|nr:hypothetical protein [Rickettsiales bacterium]